MLSQAVIAINQSLLCFDDVALLRGAVSSTADLLFLVRYDKPDAFMHDETFVQMAAVAQSHPFTLDLAALDGATVAGAGSYLTEGNRNRVDGLKGAVQIKLVMRQDVNYLKQDLTECHICVLEFLQLMPTTIDDYVTFLDKEKKGKEAAALKAAKK